MKNKQKMYLVFLIPLLITLFSLTGSTKTFAGGEDPEALRLQEENAAKVQPAVLGAESYAGGENSTSSKNSSDESKEIVPAVVLGAISLIVLILALLARARKNKTVSIS